ncbi:conjugal transfer protein TraB [Acidithiobacillus sp. HP-11]|uniref:conjugal transfer protein TraB n=1 Tax=Acidithiobacillus sp. HP-11 TaxID=2697656 RepID=UPI00187A4448|nr:conjugal transfer protein TraB [Acidithiobacillus sp. HP-11]MBE7567653.1 conjugal transfer protein TraB [Acidithiobacillus sp. HP-11]
MQSKYVTVSVYPVDDSRRKSAPVSRFAIPALLGALVGVLAWPHAIWLAPLALLLLPVLNKRSWMAPFCLMFGYHMATTYGLIKGTSVFFPHSGLFLGIGFWSLSSLAFALPYLAYPYIALYFRGGGLAGGSLAGGGFGAVTATIITSAVSTILPPLGIIGWTSPWLGAVAAGPTGILLTILGIFALGYWERKNQDIPVRLLMAGIVVFNLWLLGFAFPALAERVPALDDMMGHPLPTAPAGWVGINTHLGHLRSNLSYVDASMELAPKVLADLHAGDKVVLLPETLAGPWLPGTRAIWRPVIRWTARHPGQTVLLGADVPLTGCEPHGRDLRPAKGYLDALVKIQDGHQTVLPDHIPVPFSMWHPWHPRDSFRMAPFSRKPETTEIDGKKVGYLICYEQLLMWPALDLYPHGIQVLLAPANDWWARGTDIPAIQRASAKAWAAFFGVPVLFAVNQ